MLTFRASSLPLTIAGEDVIHEDVIHAVTSAAAM
jgi:hypothetical protein